MPDEYFDKAIHSNGPGDLTKGDLAATVTPFPASLLDQPTAPPTQPIAAPDQADSAQSSSASPSADATRAADG